MKRTPSPAPRPVPDQAGNPVPRSADDGPRIHVLFRRFVAGRCGLARTFWYGVFAVAVPVAALLPVLHTWAWRGSIPAAVLLAVLAGAYIVYCPLSLWALWRAAARYDGHSLWRVLAFAVTLTAFTAYVEVVKLLARRFL